MKTPALSQFIRQLTPDSLCGLSLPKSQYPSAQFVLNVGALALVFALLGTAAASAQNLVTNGNFTANAAAYTVFPGYNASGANPAAPTGWTAPGSAGVNGAGTVTTAFGPTTLPSGTDWAFIQGVGTMSQSLTSLTPGHSYRLTFQAANRAGNAAQIVVTVGDSATNYVSSGTNTPSSAAFQPYNYNFTAPASFSGTPFIQLQNLVAGDNTADFTAISLVDTTGATARPIWSGSVSGNLGGSDANFTGKTFAQVLAATNVVYFGDVDGLGAPVITSGLTTVAGGVSAPTFQFDNYTASYTLGSADATGITGASALLKTGSGTLALAGANSYTGATIISAGTLQLNNASAIAGTASLVVNSGGQLALGAGSVSYANVPALLSGSGANGRGALYLINDGANVTWPGTITVNNGTIGNFSASATGIFPNVISGSNGLAFFAGGASVAHLLTVNLNNHETYTGSTTINATYGSSAQINLGGGVNTLPATTDVTLNDQWSSAYATLDLQGNNQTLNSLTINGNAPNTANLTSSSGQPTLTLTSTAAGALAASGGTVNISSINVTVASGTDNSTDFGGPGGTATTVNITNATINSSFYSDVGRAATTTVNLNNGTVFNNSGEILIGYGNSSGNGTLNLNNGSVVNANFIRVGTTASGTVNLNAGATLNVNGVYNNGNSNSFNFNGGLIEPNGGALHNPAAWLEASLTNVQVQAGGAIINTAGTNLTIAPALLAGSPSGGLAKLGLGALTLAGANTYTGATIVSNGVLNTTTASLGAGSYAVADNSGLGVAIASPGQTLTMSSLTLGSAAGPSALNFALGTGNPTAPAIADAGALTLNGSVTANVSGLASVTPGTIVLLTYASGGAGTFVAGSLPIVAGYAFALTNDTVAKQLKLVVTQPYPSLRWAVGNGNWDTATANWQLLSGGGLVTYGESDPVTLDDTNSGTSPITVTLTTGHTPGSVNVNSTKNYILTGGAIAGTASLTKSGASTLTLSGANSYSGATTISGGTVALSGAGALGNGSALTLAGGALDLGGLSPAVGAVNLTAPAASGVSILNGSLTGNSYAASINAGDAVVSASLLGTAGLVNNGPGTLTLSGNNTYTGSTVNNAGTLQLTAGTLGTGPLNINGGTFQLDGGTVNPATGGNFNLVYSGCTVNQTAGDINYGGYGEALDATLNLSGGTSEIGLEMMLGYNGANCTANVSGSHVANWFVTRFHSGNVTVNLLPGGALYSDEIYANSSAPTAVLKFNGGTLGMSALNPGRRPGDWIHINGGTLTLYVENGGAILDTAAGSATINLPLQADGASTGGLTKLGANTLTLTGGNTYTGPTFINGGTLALGITGTLASSSRISITNGATFDVSGLSVPFTLAGGQTLSNNAAATGNLNGSLNTGSGIVALSYAAGTPALNVAGGTLTLSAATTLVIDNTGAALATGSYELISVAPTGAAIAGTLPGSATVGGGGATGTTSLQLINGGLYLVVGTFAPQVTAQPVSLTRYAGGTAIFTAGILGSPAPQLQWLHNGGPVANATNATLVLANLQLTNAGSYVLTATNSYGGTNTDSTVSLTVLPANSPQYLGNILANNPMGYWRFNDGEPTNAYDYIGGNNAYDPLAAPLQAGPQPPTFPGFETNNTAPFMNGFSQGYAATVSLFNNLTNYTIMGWFNIDPAQYPIATDPFNHPQGRASLFGQAQAVELGFYLGTNLYFYAPGISATIFVTNGFAPGQWEYVAVVADAAANTSTFYLNGVVVGTATAGTGTANTNRFSMGKNVTYPTSLESGYDTAFFPGSIDEVAVFDHPLSASAIQTIYQVGTGSSAVAPTNVVARMINLSGVNNVVITGSGGSSGSGYTVLTSTNVATPVINWTTNATGRPFGLGGAVTYTNPVSPATPELFYRIRVP